MHYIIYCEDTPDSAEKRRSVRPAHLKRLQDLKDKGHLILAGPVLGGDNDNIAVSGVKGSVIIAEFPNLSDAKSWVAADPYVTANVYASVNVQPMKVLL